MDHGIINNSCSRLGAFPTLYSVFKQTVQLKTINSTQLKEVGKNLCKRSTLKSAKQEEAC